MPYHNMTISEIMSPYQYNVRILRSPTWPQGSTDNNKAMHIQRTNLAKEQWLLQSLSKSDLGPRITGCMHSVSLYE